ncbi:hypothetical protein quinque_006323 [Culex quinquefasciatus]
MYGRIQIEPPFDLALHLAGKETAKGCQIRYLDVLDALYIDGVISGRPSANLRKREFVYNVRKSVFSEAKESWPTFQSTSAAVQRDPDPDVDAPRISAHDDPAASVENFDQSVFSEAKESLPTFPSTSAAV